MIIFLYPVPASKGRFMSVRRRGAGSGGRWMRKTYRIWRRPKLRTTRHAKPAVTGAEPAAARDAPHWESSLLQRESRAIVVGNNGHPTRGCAEQATHTARGTPMLSAVRGDYARVDLILTSHTGLRA